MIRDLVERFECGIFDKLGLGSFLKKKMLIEF